MYEIPTTVRINGEEYAIRNDGDYRVILDCFLALEDDTLDSKERLLAALIIFYKDFNSVQDIYSFEYLEEAVTGMYNFFNCGQEPSENNSVNYKLIDWEKDSQLICSAINKVANKEIRAEKYLHWWTFMGYYAAIGESALTTIIHIRDKIVRQERLDKTERKYKQRNPQYFDWNHSSVEQREADRLVTELWNSGV